jgi:Fe-Mn family superoxide dismutase
MDSLFNKSVKDIIKNTLSVSEPVNESLVAQQKNFDIKTDFLSSANLSNHIELYKGYLENFNQISAELDAADRSSVNGNHSQYRNLKNDETYNMNAAYLHELFFANIGDNDSRINMDTLSYMRLTRDFGTFDDWQKDFIACSMSSRCGWAVTYLNTYTQTYMNCVIDLHSKNVPAGMYPVIVMDLWQHAYYKDYLKDSKTYLTAMMKQFRWPIIEKRFEKADKIIQILKGAR